MIATAKDVRAWAQSQGITQGVHEYSLSAAVWWAYLEPHPEATNWRDYTDTHGRDW